MVKICPISLRNVNENVSRLNAFFTFVFSLTYLITGSFWVLAVLLADFLLRLAMEGNYNPIIRLNKFFIEIFNIPKAMINAGPKIFAARIGFLISLIGLVLAIFGLTNAAYFVIGILAFFSLLEFSAGICVACKIYPYALFLNDAKIFR